MLRILLKKRGIQIAQERIHPKKMNNYQLLTNPDRNRVRIHIFGCRIHYFWEICHVE
jgi:hypothetical protein